MYARLLTAVNLLHWFNGMNKKLPCREKSVAYCAGFLL